jgi:hypothetical protein
MKKQWRPPSKKMKRGKNLSPRNMKACHNVTTALLQSVAEIATQSTMKSITFLSYVATSFNTTDNCTTEMR